MADRSLSAGARMAPTPGFPMSFKARSVEYDRASLVAGVGLAVELSERARLEASYNGSYQSDYHEHRFQLGLGIRF